MGRQRRCRGKVPLLPLIPYRSFCTSIVLPYLGSPPFSHFLRQAFAESFDTNESPIPFHSLSVSSFVSSFPLIFNTADARRSQLA